MKGLRSKVFCTRNVLITFQNQLKEGTPETRTTQEKLNHYDHAITKWSKSNKKCPMSSSSLMTRARCRWQLWWFPFFYATILTLEPGSLCDVCADEFGPCNLPHHIPCGPFSFSFICFPSSILENFRLANPSSQVMYCAWVAEIPSSQKLLHISHPPVPFAAIGSPAAQSYWLQWVRQWLEYPTKKRWLLWASGQPPGGQRLPQNTLQSHSCD